MDSYSDHPSEYELPEASGVETPADAASAIGSDERRMHVRAYNYWCSLLNGRDYPSIEDLEPANVEDFASNSVLLDFTEGSGNPATPYVGQAIRAECGLDEDIRSIDNVPGRSLLSRLTDHYLQIIANRAPVGFEAEFVNQRGRSICYRGILMPFSSDGDTIDFIYGVINWKDVGEPAEPVRLIAALSPLTAEDLAAAPDETLDLLDLTDPVETDGQAPHIGWEDGPLADTIDPAGLGGEELPDPDAGLSDHLSAARESAEVCKQADGRSRAALYRALGMAYDFAVATKRVPDDYAEILEDAGVKAQARAPMTPIVKLVFGIDYDKTRLTEFAAALSFADRQDVDFGGFEKFLETVDGGLKGMVAAERKARRPDKVADDRPGRARSALRTAPPLPLSELPTNEEFALVITRRNANGLHEVVRLVSDSALLERALSKAAS